MKVVFFGNHTVGVVVLSELLTACDVVGVVAHPEDPEDGVRYESVHDFAVGQGLSVIRARGREPCTEAFVRAASPDLIWVTDYRYLLPQKLIDMAKHAAINIHPSLLPRYRGRASLNWAILNGETETGLSAHYMTASADTGDVIEQIRLSIRDQEDIGDVLNNLIPMYSEITRRVIRYFRFGNIPRKKQDESQASVFPARKPEDGLIDWYASAVTVRNLIRAVAAPYPGAFSFFRSKKIFFWKAELVSPSGEKKEPGTVLDNSQGILTVQCGEGVIQAIKVTGSVDLVSVGAVLGGSK